MLGRPRQDSGITRAGEANVLDAHQIDAGLAQPDAAHDVVVEVQAARPRTKFLAREARP